MFYFSTSDVLLFHHQMVYCSIMMFYCSNTSVPLFSHEMFYCPTMIVSLIDYQMLYCSPSDVRLFNHGWSTLPPSDFLFFHHDCSTVPPLDVILFDNEMFYCSTIRCCKCPQAGESEVELIDFVIFFCCHSSALTSQVLIIISHVIKLFRNTSKDTRENRVSTFLKKERRTSIYWNSRSRQ